jgi:hypothetical protein
VPRRRRFSMVGPVDLDHIDALGGQVAAQPSAVAASAFHPDPHDGTEACQPLKQTSVAGRGGRQAVDAELAADALSGAAATCTSRWTSTPPVTTTLVWAMAVMAVASLSKLGVGWHTPARAAGKTTKGLWEQARSRSLGPTGGCRTGISSPVDGSLSRQPEGVSRNSQSDRTRETHPKHDSHPTPTRE